MPTILQRLSPEEHAQLATAARWFADVFGHAPHECAAKLLAHPDLLRTAAAAARTLAAACEAHAAIGDAWEALAAAIESPSE